MISKAMIIGACTMVMARALWADSDTAETSPDIIPMYRVSDGAAAAVTFGKEVNYVAYYFSASWCPPCRKTTPPLLEEYRRMQSTGSMPVEIVLVGGDHSEQEMFDYMEKYDMKWPAVVYQNRGMVEKYASNSIPHLVLVDRYSGKVVTHGSGLGAIDSVVNQMRKFSGVGASEPFRTQGWLSKYGVLIAVGLSVGAIVLVQRRKESRKRSVSGS